VKTAMIRNRAKTNGRKTNPAAALKALAAIRSDIRKHGWKFDGMTTDQVVAQMRKTRETLVKEDFASRSR